MLDVSIIKCLSDNYSYLIRDKKTNLIIWSDGEYKQAYRAEARQRNLDCDVGQEEIVLLKKQFSNFNGGFLCTIAKKKKNSTKIC